MKTFELRNKLIEKGLKVTPQRIAILEAVHKLNSHPTAEKIFDFVRKNNPNISMATVYKVLDVLVAKGLLSKVKSEKDSMRYDAITEKHHHLYSSDSEDIVDYYNDEINKILSDYFKKHNIPDFEIEDIKLQIIGKFKNRS